MIPLRQEFAMKTKPILATLAATALLAACSGGGGGSDPTAPPPPAPGTVAISGRAVDGALRGATACYDLDDNGGCDSAEPRSAPTASDGSFRIDVAPADAGRHAVVVDVPADAIDADTGSTVPRAFTLRAPATGAAGAQAVFVSPLTTLVHAYMADSGASRADAEQLVQSLGALELSPLADFTAQTGAAGTAAARLARLAQLTANEQRLALANAAPVGGVAPTAAEIEREASSALLAALPALAGTLADPLIANASGAALQTLLQAQARTLAAQAGPSAEALRAALTARRLAEPAPPPTPTAGGSLTALRYTDADNWFMRTLQQSADDTVADAQGYQRYNDVRLQASPGGVPGNASVTYAWAFGTSRARAGDLHWNGSAWVGCSLTARYLTRTRDAQGRGDYVYCDGWETGTGIRRFVDLTDHRLDDVVRDQIRSFPGSSAGVAFRDWGPGNLALYGDAVFPAGAYLIYQSNTVTSTAFSYDVQANNVVNVFNAAVSAGGDARAQPGLACNDPLQNSSAATTPADTLETLIARNGGKPCQFNPGGTTPNVSGATNEWWGNATVGLGDLAGVNTLPPGTGAYYNTTAALRVSFAANGSGALFHRCYRRASDSSPRNCSLLGLGSWKIQTLGDARVLSFNVMPALAQKLGYARVFVERGGKVYFGYKNAVGGTSIEPRLNLVAANAVAFQLGLPRIRPVTQPGTATGARAAALATLKGAWGGADPGGTAATVFRFGDNGRFFLAEATAPDGFLREQSGAELGWLDYDPAAQQISTLLEVDSSLTSGTSHPSAFEQPVTISPTLLSFGSGGTAPRLPSVATNLVGLWALGSATDLSVPHLAFFGNGRFMLVHHQGNPAPGDCFNGSAGDGQCPPGVEFGSYTYNPAVTLPTPSPATLRLFAVLYDTNGCAGAFNNCPAAAAIGAVNTEANFVLTLSADGTTLTTQRGTDPVLTWFRVPPQ